MVKSSEEFKNGCIPIVFGDYGDSTSLMFYQLSDYRLTTDVLLYKLRFVGFIMNEHDDDDDDDDDDDVFLRKHSAVVRSKQLNGRQHCV